MDLGGLISCFLHNFSVVGLELFDLTSKLLVLRISTYIHNTVFSDNKECMIFGLSLDRIEPVAAISQLYEVKKDGH